MNSLEIEEMVAYQNRMERMIAKAFERGYAAAREQAAQIALDWREEGASVLAKRIRAMEPESEQESKHD